MLYKSKLIHLSQGLGTISNSFLPNSSISVSNDTSTYINNAEVNVSEFEEKDEIKKVSNEISNIFKELNLINKSNVDKSNVISKINETQRTEIIQQIISTVEKSNLKKKKEIISQLRLKKTQNSFFVNLNKALNYQIKDFNNNKIKIKKAELSEFTRVFTDKAKNYSVNINDNEVNSKKLFLELENFKKHVYERTKIEAKLKKVKVAIDILETGVNTIMIGSTVALLSSMLIAGLSGGMLAPVAIPITTLSTGLLTLFTPIKILIALSKIIFEDISTYYYKINIRSNNEPIGDSLTILDFALNNDYHKNTTYMKFILGRSKWLNIFGSLVSKVSTLWDFVNLENNINNYIDSFQTIGETWDDIFKLENKIQDMEKRIENISSRFDWVVLDETPQDKPYKNGGHGGRNLVFKNIKSNETFYLDDLLKLPNWKLKLMRLQKVHSKTVGWYIRTLKNQNMEDNLG